MEIPPSIHLGIPFIYSSRSYSSPEVLPQISQGIDHRFHKKNNPEILLRILQKFLQGIIQEFLLGLLQNIHQVFLYEFSKDTSGIQIPQRIPRKIFPVIKPYPPRKWTNTQHVAIKAIFVGFPLF